MRELRRTCSAFGVACRLEPMSGSAPVSSEAVGAHWSLAALLFPLPCRLFHVLADVAAMVSRPLVAPVMVARLAASEGVCLTSAEIENVFWKLETYLPSVLRVQHSPGALPPKLKELRAACPDLPLVLAGAYCERCSHCPDNPPLEKTAVIDRSQVNQNFAVKVLLENRFKFYSFTAGLQHLAVQEAKCHQCGTYHCCGWQYKKGAYGRMYDLVFFPAEAPKDYFLVPKTRSFYAVDLPLLQHFTDAFVHSSSSFAAATVVWANQHPEKLQQDLVHGPDFTMTEHTTAALEVAWFAWQVLRRGGPEASTLPWSFTDDGFEELLLHASPLLRTQHLLKVAAHIPECPRCSDYLLLLADGKQGARRFICAGLEGSVEFKDFNVALLTGCLRHSSTREYHCKRCRPATSQSALIPQTEVKGVEGGQAPNGVWSEVRYNVDCYDPDTGETFQGSLPRHEVRAELLHKFEKSLLPTKKDHRNKKARNPFPGEFA